MRKTILAVFTTVLAVFLMSPEVSWGQAIKYGQAGMPFLTIDVGGRVAGMAGTKVGVVGDAEAMFSNPAGLAMMDGLSATTSKTNWIADIGHFGAGVAYNAGKYGTFGINLVSMEYGDIQQTIPYQGFDPEKRLQGYEDIGTFTVSEYAIGVSYGRQIISQFYVGGNVKWAYQNLGDVRILDPYTNEETMAENEVSNLVFDFGTLYYPGFKDLRFGVTFRNFSGQVDYYDQRFELPLTFDFGVAMDVLKLFQEDGDTELTVALDALHPRDYSERVHLGAEYNLYNVLFVRGGYKFNYDEEALSAGLGINYDIGGIGLKADYAYTAFGIFDAVHRFSIGVALR